jgi:hypothetical protein
MQAFKVLNHWQSVDFVDSVIIPKMQTDFIIHHAVKSGLYRVKVNVKYIIPC